MQATTIFNPTQQHLLQMFSHVSSDSFLEEMKRVLLDFYASKTQEGIDKYFEDNHLGDEYIESLLNEHLRTPYSHAK